MFQVCFVTEVLSTLRNSSPRARKGFPQASLCACAALGCAPPVPLPLSSVSRVGDPPPCSCYQRGYLLLERVTTQTDPPPEEDARKPHCATFGNVEPGPIQQFATFSGKHSRYPLA